MARFHQDPDWFDDNNQQRENRYHNHPFGLQHHEQTMRQSSPVSRQQQAVTSIPPPPLPPHCEVYIHPQRCPPLNLEFMWRMYDRRNGRSEEAEQYNRTQERIGILKSQGFPTGLAALILQNAVDHPIRIFLVENSGSMLSNDGHLVAQSSSSGKVQTVQCTRWEGITSTLVWHAELAAWCQTPTAVRLLNDPGINVGPQQVGIASSKNHSSTEEVGRLKNLLQSTRPNGATTPISAHLQDLLQPISNIVPILMSQKRRITLILCVDSIPTDGEGKQTPQVIDEFLSVLRKLLDWPVQVVLRLSAPTDERVRSFYRNLASNTGVCGGWQSQRNSLYTQYSDDFTNFQEHLQILDDYVCECEAVQEHNPWLHYGYPLHLCREQGVCIKAIEALTQRPLSGSEVLEVAGYLFGEVINEQQILSNESELKLLRKKIEALNSESIYLWSPIKRKFVPWIDIKQLDKLYFHRHKGIRRGSANGDQKCTVM